MPDHQRHRRRAIASGAAFVAILFTVACDAEATLPQQVQGRYVTLDPVYADRSFTLTTDTFLLDLGEHGTKSHPITKVRQKKTGDGRVLYEVIYLNSSRQKYTMSFYHDQSSGDSLVMKNRPQVVWTRGETNR